MVTGSDPNTNSFVRVWGAPSRTAEEKRRGRHTWRMRLSPAKGWAKTGQMAPPLTQSSPPGKEKGSREGKGEGFWASALRSSAATHNDCSRQSTHYSSTPSRINPTASQRARQTPSQITQQQAEWPVSAHRDKYNGSPRSSEF